MEAITSTRRVKGIYQGQRTLSSGIHAHDGLASLLTIWQTLTAKDLNRRCVPGRRVVWEGLNREANPYRDFGYPMMSTFYSRKSKQHFLLLSSTTTMTRFADLLT